MMRIGSDYLGNGKCKFAVWAPLLESVGVRIISPEERLIALRKADDGCWQGVVEGVYPGALYFYRLDDSTDRPDPASNLQPEGVHGPSQVIDHRAFDWTDAGWRGIPVDELVIYELHVGAFTPEATFDAIIQRLGEIRDVGINAIEIMPIAQFPGDRNWGYDGVHPFAVQNSYGGPEGLKRLVNAAHRTGIAVILDVVYNHFGPEGNYLRCFAPYFTSRYKTPWGDAINFDDAYSDGVRDYFLQNALYWLREYHFDGLRLDAVHAIFDMSAKHILQELAESVAGLSEQMNRKFYLIAESDLNDVRLIRPAELGGYGLDGQWCDDFHHSLRTMLTGEETGYYKDFGHVQDLVKAYEEGFVYSGQYSDYRRRRHGSSSKDVPARQLVVFSQNHDQVGNRMLGERLSSLVSFESLKLAAGAVLFSPYVPMLFMGEEYAEEAPFLYFVSHSDPDLIDAVREGRMAEFAAFRWKGEPPDPQSVESFLRSKLRWEKRAEGRQKIMLEFYRRLIDLRKNTPALSTLDKENLEVSVAGDRILTLRRWHNDSQTLCIMGFNKEDSAFRAGVPHGTWKKILDSADAEWDGPGTTLPAIMRPAEQLTVRASNLALFELESKIN